MRRGVSGGMVNGLRLLAAAALMLALAGRAVGAPRGESTPVTNVVLVHGAWADGSSWSGVIERLLRAGYHVTAVQLGLQSLDQDVAKVRGVLAAQSGPTLLVAHSFGGAVVTQLGARAPNVVGIVYESAFAPDQGETMRTIVNQSPPAPGSVAIRPDRQGFLGLDPSGFLSYFAPDVAHMQAQVMESVQKPIAASVLMGTEKFGPPAWRSFPTWYLVTDQDQMIPPEAQQKFAARMGARVASIRGSHAAMVSHPDEVSGFIIAAAEGASAKPAHAAK
ncbi:MAG TPA: alpha/beta hydrolase [Polyangia bacterium]|nr:alpha/beta hydrolase [Polyangia bacterium]